VLGGVCSGVARYAGLDPLLLRIAVVAVTVLSGGTGLLAYLAAWVLIPREDVSPAAPQLPAGAAPVVDVRAAWSAVGNDLKTLAGELRKPGPGATSPGTTAPADTASEAAAAPDAVPTGTGMPPSENTSTDPTDGPPPGAVPSQRTPIEAADDAATALGERLRAPEVQAGARRAAASVSQALSASVDELGRRVRRDRTGENGGDGDGQR
jgi:phage shock protein PspC (stress-responsive transcriptional regulator)